MQTNEAFEAAVLRHLEPEPVSPEYNAAVRNIARDKSILQAVLESLRQGGWQSMDSAPDGSHREIDTGKGKRKIFEPEWCFVMLKGRRYWTYKLDCGRWNGLTKNEIPDCWHPAPTPPEKE